MRKMKKFALGGRAERGQDRYDRMIADIEKDYQKAQGRKSGRGLEVARAKYEQRMADAKDDLAKARGEDRTASRAAERAAERELTMTRRFGARKVPALEDTGPLVRPSVRDDLKTPMPSLKPSAPARRAAAPTPQRRTAAPAPRREAPAPQRREAAARPPETRGGETVVTAPKKRPETREEFNTRVRGTVGRALGAPFRAFAEYNPLSMAGKAIFDGEPSKPATPAAPKTRTPAQAERKADYMRRAASERAAGRTGSAQFYEREASRLKKGGKVDGCAVRGKTKAKRK